MRKNSPWNLIDTPSDPAAEIIRRADPDHPLEFFRGKDHLGRHLFIFRISGDAEELARPPELAGIDVFYEFIDSGLWQLKLALRDAQQFDIFTALCANLMQATRRISPGEQKRAVGVVLTRLRRWQQMLQKKRSDLLPESVRIGLFGELLFLRDVLRSRMTATDSLKCWRGPLGEEQDFAVGPILVEIKTQRATSDRHLRISSPDQLYSRSGDIILCHQTLHTEARDGKGDSLNALARQVISDMETADPVAGDCVRSVLMEFGYEDRPEYNEPVYVLNRRDYYRVRDSFPRITPEVIPAGVVSLSYSIEVETCSDFLENEEIVFGEVCNGG
ncbi:MAG: PD-(D/E)XK motif protein [Candidatus Dadabacteria bacterium]|nr:PD-(D/E)XK motif protein [Candidatus Dadabacteria bacterium]